MLLLLMGKKVYPIPGRPVYNQMKNSSFYYSNRVNFGTKEFRKIGVKNERLYRQSAKKIKKNVSHAVDYALGQPAQ